jgi:hypothetical protein
VLDTIPARDIEENRGFIFLFNPNARRLTAEFTLDATIGVPRDRRFVLKEMYPVEGRLIGKAGSGTPSGVWTSGDRVSIGIDGTTALDAAEIPRIYRNAPAAVCTGRTQWDYRESGATPHTPATRWRPGASTPGRPGSRSRNRPRPARPFTCPSAQMISPREMVTTGQPRTFMPS